MNTNQNSSARLRIQVAALIGATGLLTGCGEAQPTNASATLNQTVAESPSPATPSPAPGPSVLTTVGMFDGGASPARSYPSRAGTFAIQEVDGIDTLTLDGKPAQYLLDGQQGHPAPITADSSIAIVGVFELADESVAWVLISGGSACPASHVLVGASGGKAQLGQMIPGCDDRGTMRGDGERIAFEAGGSTGTYQDGVLKVESEAQPAAE